MTEIEQAISYYRKELKNAPHVIQYLKDRGLTAQTVNEFKIGYAPKNPTYNHLFRNRIMIPIQDTLGDYVAFVGRTLGDEDAKYLNSWESAEYQKGRILFGFAKAFKHIQATERVILVEGQFDLMTLWQNKVYNVVAGSGTGFTPIQARLLSRYASKIYLAFDDDQAGQKAEIRTRKHLENAGFRSKDIIVGHLPDGEDPDSFVRKYGVHEFKKLFNTDFPS